MIKRFIFVISFIVFSCAQNTKTDTSSPQEQIPEPIDLKTKLDVLLKELEKPFDSTPYQVDVEGLKLEVATFFSWANIINQALNNDDGKIIKLGRILNEKLIAIQVKEFPLIRKRYSVLLAPKLVRYNASVKIIDQIDAHLWVYSKDFASYNVNQRQIRNRNNFEKSIKETVKLFRFKTVSYEESEKSSISSSYTIKSLDDDEIVDYGSSEEATFNEDNGN